MKTKIVDTSFLNSRHSGVFWWIIRRDGWFDADLCFERIIIHRYEIIFSGIQCPKISLLRIPFVFEKKRSCRRFLKSSFEAFRSFLIKNASVGDF